MQKLKNPGGAAVPEEIVDSFTWFVCMVFIAEEQNCEYGKEVYKIWNNSILIK